MEKRRVELDINTGKSSDQLEYIADILKDIHKAVDKVDNKADVLADVGKGAVKGQKGIKGMLKGLTSIGNLFKASGVFFVAQKIFEGLQEAFQNNQIYVDAFAVAGKMATKVIGDLTSFVFNNFGKVSDFFKSVFDDPKGMIDRLVQSIKDNLMERLNSAIKMFGLLGSAVKKLFARDFDGAMADAQEAGKEFVDVMTGVDGSVDKISETVVKGTKALVDYTKSTYDAAKSAVELKKEAELLEAINMGLIESYDIQAEKQRQLRDDESKSIDDRIKANNKLGEVLEEQMEKMTANAQKVRDAALAEYNLNKDNQEAKLALIQAENELQAVKARVVGFEAEQLTNENALLKEKKELLNELNLIGKADFDKQREEADQLLVQQIETINKQVANEEERFRLIEAAAKQHEKTVGDINEEENRKAIELKLAETNAKIDLGKTALGALQSLAKEGSAGAKALAVGQTILDAYKSINATFANAAANPSTILFPAYPYIQAAAAGVQAFATVKKILTVQPDKPQGGGAQVSGPRASFVPQTQSPDFNVVGASPENQLATAIGGQEQKPVKAFVVSSEVTSQQALDRGISGAASLG